MILYLKWTSWGRLWPCCSLSLEGDKLWRRCTAAPARWASEAPRCTRWSWTGCWWWTPSPAGWPPSERGWRRRKHLRIKQTKKKQPSGRPLAYTLHHCIAWCTCCCANKALKHGVTQSLDVMLILMLKPDQPCHSSPRRNNHSCTQMDTRPTVAHRDFLAFLQTNTKSIQSIQQPNCTSFNLKKKWTFYHIYNRGCYFIP